MKTKIIHLTFLLLTLSVSTDAKHVLLGDDAPFPNRLDGDFEAVQGWWQQEKQSPFWETTKIKGDDRMGLHFGSMYCKVEEGMAESRVLDANPNYQQPNEGDVMDWSFAADLEYISNGTLSVSLVFGTYERVLAENVALIGGDKTPEVFSGQYVVNLQDAEAGLPFVRARFYSDEAVKVILYFVNISVVDPAFAGPEIQAAVVPEGIQLDWTDSTAADEPFYKVYRSGAGQKSFDLLTETTNPNVLNRNEDIVNGLGYRYVVTRVVDGRESSGSNVCAVAKFDNVAPAPPGNLQALSLDTEIKLSWQASEDKDVNSYSVYRGEATGKHFREIAHDVRKLSCIDYTPVKETENTYVVISHDHSGNESERSKVVTGRVKAVVGTSFSDLILPMPIHHHLRSDIWGAEGVVPRDPDNGVEDPEWSYWGGRPVEDHDGKFHMNVTRWPANATKGHWEWPESTVAHVVADQPTGPYEVVRDIAYGMAGGLGHNPDVVLLNDGSYLLYSLIDWEAHLFHSDSMNGPWDHLGIMTVEWTQEDDLPERAYRFYRNLSGVHLADGRFLFVTKAGAIMISEGTDPLGPYDVLTKPLQGNAIIPAPYRNSNYEDPVMWKDEVQFHMMINAFLDYRAIYLRSPDGIHWKFNSGTAYTPEATSYVDGTRTHWYKLERPHVLTDSCGRATHLSLAAIDVPKRDDMARDQHSSKNLIIPLVVHKRMELLNTSPIDENTPSIQILLKSEPGFNAQTDVDLKSLNFGANEVVDFGGGCRVLKTEKRGEDLLIEFDGAGNGFTEKNFAGKLLGKTTTGELIIGFCKLPQEQGKL